MKAIFFSLVVSLLVCDAFFLSKAGFNDDKNLQIGIIGGGPAGLYAAKKLAAAGYKKITILEAADEVCDTIKTINVNGRVHDLTTRYIPGATTLGPGVDPNLQELIDEYNLATHAVQTPIKYVQLMDIDGISRPIDVQIPHIFAEFFNPASGKTPQNIVADLIFGFELLRGVHLSGSLAGCRQLLNVPAGMSFATWAQAINKPAFTRLAQFSNDLFLGGPSNHHDVCHFLNIRTHFLVVDIVDVLKKMGVTNCSPIPGMSDTLSALLNPAADHRRRQFNDGYQNLCNKMAASEAFEIKLSSRVNSVTPDNNDKIVVTTNDGRQYSFQRIIIATAGQTAAAFLDGAHPASPLLQQTWSTPVHVHAISTTGDLCEFPTFNAVLYPAAAALAGSTMFPSVIALNKEYFDDGLVIGIGYTDPSESEDTRVQRVKTAVNKMGLTAGDVVEGLSFNYPSTITAEAVTQDWYTQMENIQGTQGVYFIGEAISGYGIPTVLEYVNSHLSQHFAMA